MTAPALTADDSLASLTCAGDAPIIYEVNLSVPRDRAREYLRYLDSFTRNVCATVPGFTKCSVYTQPKPSGLHWLSDEGDVKVYIVVHYHIDSEKHLDDYLSTAQDSISKQDQNIWGFLVVNRRILRLQFSL
ncbi:hypothetical protein HDU83_002489 [Entophlyctis luteolus]|nr:hypothetical protein HDU82_004019 [Entophlyctis luteolus]KAJ3355841.1 hypothetical protein HDU83_002489 [Entophlyctis luteolus]KAJ3391366.1 hypothetical protein HDU84_006111 [Entophlyctis sp. JEL0112]